MVPKDAELEYKKGRSTSVAPSPPSGLVVDSSGVAGGLNSRVVPSPLSLYLSRFLIPSYVFVQVYNSEKKKTQQLHWNKTLDTVS